MDNFDEFFFKSMTYTNMKVTCESNKLIKWTNQYFDSLRDEIVDAVKPIKNDVDKHELQMPEIRAFQLQQEDRSNEHEDRIANVERRCDEQERNQILIDLELAKLKSILFCYNEGDMNYLPS